MPGGVGPGGGPVVGPGGRGPGVGPGGFPFGAGGTGIFKPGKSELQARFFFQRFCPKPTKSYYSDVIFFKSHIDYGAGGFGALPTGGMLSYSVISA